MNTTVPSVQPYHSPVISRGDLVSLVSRYQPDVDRERLKRAFDYAKFYHEGQARASGHPYYSHPLSVAKMLTKLHLDDVTIIAGLLHDAVEDTQATYNDISEMFGKDAADLVDGVTKLDKLEYRSVETKQAENFQKFILATVKDVRVLLIKLADRLDNMRTIQYLPKIEKRKRISKETMEIYAPLARRVGLYDIACELEDLAFTQINPSAKRAIETRLEELTDTNDLVRIRRGIRKIMNEAGINCRIKGRRKQPYSIWRKLERKSINFRDVADIFAYRIIVDDVNECYRTLGAIHKAWAVLPDRFRDFISVPKPNGYRSLHTTVRASGNRRAELQIRTEEMDEIAERGVAAHWTYKEQQYGFDAESARQAGIDPLASLRSFSELLEEGTEPTEFLENAKLEMYRHHVFAFTPEGKLIVLPSGAMPLDFAYAVHTAVGDTCRSVKINGVHRSLRTELQNGDIVEIVRDRSPQPVMNWEALTITAKARSAQRRLVRSKEAKEFKTLGTGIIRKTLRRAGVDPVDVSMRQLAARAGFDKVEDMAIAAGKGRLKVSEILEAAFPGHTDNNKHVEHKIQLDNEHADLLVAGKDLTPGVTLHLAECCSPLPGERIIGIQEPERGVNVHTIFCPKLSKFEDSPERWIDLRWTALAQTDAIGVGRIKVTAIHKKGVLATLCSAVAQANGNITRISTEDRDEEFIDMQIDIEVEAVKHLTQILAALKSLAVVEQAERLQEDAHGHR